MYDFMMVGHCISFSIKIEKHILGNNPRRVRDYILEGTKNGFHENHPCIESLYRGIEFIKQSGGKVMVNDNNIIAIKLQQGSGKWHYSNER